jgi:hypothetical protein
VSTQGHDYRSHFLSYTNSAPQLIHFCVFSPDYKELTQLKVLYPTVPILALSATCPPDVLRDLIKILRLPPPTGGRGTTTPFSWCTMLTQSM